MKLSGQVRVLIAAILPNEAQTPENLIGLTRADIHQRVLIAVEPGRLATAESIICERRSTLTSHSARQPNSA
jgi:hypothetical protein